MYKSVDEGLPEKFKTCVIILRRVLYDGTFQYDMAFGHVGSSGQWVHGIFLPDNTYEVSHYFELPEIPF